MFVCYVGRVFFSVECFLEDAGCYCKGYTVVGDYSYYMGRLVGFGCSIEGF